MIEQHDLEDLVSANRILDHENIVDAYGHVSIRNPRDPSTFLLACSKSPALIGPADIITFGMDGEPVSQELRPLYSERFIHAGVYVQRPDVRAVIHSHAEEVLPFGITDVELRPVIHSASTMGPSVPVWDIARQFGDTDLLVRNLDQASDMARTLSSGSVVLMRGHGFVVAAATLIDAIRLAIYVPKNARVLMAAMRMSQRIKYLSEGEIDARLFDADRPGKAVDYDPKGPGLRRAWDYWRNRVDQSCTCGRPKCGGET
jgi:HCOMODA/2-hydroxy-3-carboxy-muconic semialdehyde decarboxylase